jgi:hypothetical protein
MRLVTLAALLESGQGRKKLQPRQSAEGCRGSFCGERESGNLTARRGSLTLIPSSSDQEGRRDRLPQTGNFGLDSPKVGASFLRRNQAGG